MMGNTIQDETLEITCVTDFLNALKNDVEELGSNKERFFRGLSKTDYIETDYPSIYRSPDNNPKYEPYIKYEHEMFYDLVSRFPEQFSSCKNTFEHLVMMQHYEFPTRLLDVTSNPLVALYFACVDKYGNVDEKDAEGKELDGAVTIYDIPNRQIKNYNSDTVTILSNLARIDENYNPFYITYRYFVEQESVIRLLYGKKFTNEHEIKFDKLNIKLLELISTQLENFFKHDSITYINEVCTMLTPSPVDITSILNTQLDNLKSKIQDLKKYYLPYIDDEYLSDLNKFNTILKNLLSILRTDKSIEHKFHHLILEEKNYFLCEKIIYEDLDSVICVKPKLNNPRILNQNGIFLLFGFAGLNKTKLEPPKQHFEFKATKSDSEEKIDVIIKGKYKQKIINELKKLGIHRAFLFPEIDKTAQFLITEYKNPLKK